MSVGLAILMVTAGLAFGASGLHAHGEILVDPSWSASHPGPHVITLQLALDEEWRAQLGCAEERMIMERVRQLFLAANIYIEWQAPTEWESADDAAHVRGLLDELVTRRSNPAADITIGLSAQRGDGADGVARRSAATVVVRHHAQHLERDASVIAHEIGHILGAHHHRCIGHRCLMAPSGFAYSEEWCPRHLRILQANAGLFEWGSEPGTDTLAPS